MRAIRITAISILAVGLLAGSAAGVTAQEEAAASEASYFTWDTAGPPEFSLDSSTGLEIVSVPVEATDTRASGTLTDIANGGQVESDGWEYGVLISSLRLVNDGGSWVGTRRGMHAANFADESAGGIAWLDEYAGEGGYEGLTMYAFRVYTGAGEASQSVGLIVPTDAIPPVPELPAD